MYWEKTTEQDKQKLDTFISRHESGCQNISSRLYKNGQPEIPGAAYARLWMLKEENEILGLVLQQTGAYWIPFFLSEAKQQKEIDSRLNELVSLGIPFGLMGRKEDVLLLEKQLKPARDSIEYHYMKKEDLSAPFHSSREIKKAGFFSQEKLLPLELAYQKEEVYRDPASVDSRFVRKLLARQLRRQLVFWGQENGNAICKGNTNGRGRNYDQLGGIYTAPEYRGQGWGEELVNTLCHALGREKRKALLFVKKENTPACRLYEKCGFDVFQEFRITYY